LKDSGALKVLRFIDGKIITYSCFTETQTGLKNQLGYYESNGILVYFNVKDIPIIDEEPIIPDFPGEENIVSRPTHKEVKGTYVYLTREGQLVEFDMEGKEAYDDDPMDYEFHLDHAKPITPLEAVKAYPGFKDHFIRNFTNELKQAIKDNPNKAPIFKNVVQYLKQPKDAFLISIPVDLLYSLEPLAQFLPNKEVLTRDAAEKSVIDYLHQAIKDWKDMERSDYEANNRD
jgi:hypothetical protein